jgi:hypothetical protein
MIEVNYYKKDWLRKDNTQFIDRVSIVLVFPLR